VCKFSEKKVRSIIEILVGMLIKIQLKGTLFQIQFYMMLK
jgi:hypothetical protein